MKRRPASSRCSGLVWDIDGFLPASEGLPVLWCVSIGFLGAVFEAIEVHRFPSKILPECLQVCRKGIEKSWTGLPGSESSDTTAFDGSCVRSYAALIPRLIPVVEFAMIANRCRRCAGNVMPIFAMYNRRDVATDKLSLVEPLGAFGA